MLRFILERNILDLHVDYRDSSIKTIDLDVPEIETLLVKGGSGENGYDYTKLIGVEILPKD